MSEESPATPAVAADAGDSRAAAAESKPESTTIESVQKQDDGKQSDTEEKERPTGLLYQWSEGDCRVANLLCLQKLRRSQRTQKQQRPL